MNTTTEKKTFGTATSWYLTDDFGNYIDGTENFDKAYNMYFYWNEKLNPVEDDPNGECIIWLMEEDEQGNTRVHYINY